MLLLSGKGVVDAIAIGKLTYHERKNYTVSRHTVDDVRQEVLRFQAAKTETVRQLQGLYRHALNEVLPETAMIFETHQVMLEDLDFNEYVIKQIENKKMNAEYAVEKATAYFYDIFVSMKDCYMQDRSADLQDVSDRLLRILDERDEVLPISSPPGILAAQDLVPSETVQLERGKVLAFITAEGSENSHTAILAKDMNIPAVVGLGSQLKKEYNGMQAIVDGYSGKVYLEPDTETISFMMEKKLGEEKKKEQLRLMIGKPNVTKDGRRIELYANIANPSDVETVLENDAGGIGLMRSEFLYLNSRTYPTEERQFQAYRYVAQRMGGKTVTIRTMDIGADKKADYFRLPQEENPAMGYRAIRICLEQPEIFKTQLRAIYRASAYGNIAILFPMITSPNEVDRILKIVEEVQGDLSSRGIPYDRSVKVGLMIETPAAALISDILAGKVDYFSIGTNDLVQYTLAVDRQNPRLEWYHNSRHPAILRLIEMVVQNAHQKQIKVGVCGELAADPGMTECFLKMGVDELSMTPSMILPIRKRISEIDLHEESLNQPREQDW